MTLQNGTATTRRSKTVPDYTTVSNAMIRKSLFDRVGGFGVRWRRIQDYEFTYRVHRAGYANLHDPSHPDRARQSPRNSGLVLFAIWKICE